MKTVVKFFIFVLIVLGLCAGCVSIFACNPGNDSGNIIDKIIDNIPVNNPGTSVKEFNIVDPYGSLSGTYKYEEGMTFYDWCESKYNTAGYVCCKPDPGAESYVMIPTYDETKTTIISGFVLFLDEPSRAINPASSVGNCTGKQLSFVKEFNIVDPDGSLSGTYKYEEGMTFADWCESKYNTAGYVCMKVDPDAEPYVMIPTYDETKTTIISGFVLFLDEPSKAINPASTVTNCTGKHLSFVKEFNIVDPDGSLSGTYKYEEGMTFYEWCESKYNTAGYVCMKVDPNAEPYVMIPTYDETNTTVISGFVLFLDEPSRAINPASTVTNCTGKHLSFGDNTGGTT